MTYSPSHVVAELDGFLNSLRCFMGYPRVYGACLFKTEKPDLIIDEHIELIKDDGGKLESITDVDYKTLIGMLDKFLFSKLRENGWKHVENTEWHIIEYYGLASTAINEEGPFNPAVSEKTKALIFKTKDGKECFHYFITVEDYMILTFIEEP